MFHQLSGNSVAQRGWHKPNDHSKWEAVLACYFCFVLLLFYFFFFSLCYCFCFLSSSGLLSNSTNSWCVWKPGFRGVYQQKAHQRLQSNHNSGFSIASTLWHLRTLTQVVAATLRDAFWILGSPRSVIVWLLNSCKAAPWYLQLHHFTLIPPVQEWNNLTFLFVFLEYFHNFATNFPFQ